jgi:hypothetical protein
LVLWRMRREPDNYMVVETARSLAAILSKIPQAEFEEEDESFDVAHVGQWITDGDEVAPHPDHVVVLYTITIRDVNVPDEDEEESAA